MTLTKKQQGIVDQVRELYRKRKPLNISAIRESHPHLLLEAYKIKPFWGWKQVLEAAEIDYSKIRIHLPGRVTCRLCGQSRQTLAKHVRKVHHMPQAEYMAIHHVSEMSCPAMLAQTHRQHVTAIPHWEPNWTPEYVLDRICELRRSGVPLQPERLEQAEPATYRWAKKYFQKLDVAFLAVGVDPQTVRKSAAPTKWTQSGIIQAVRYRHALGKTVNRSAMMEHLPSLAWAAIKVFGSYDRMLQACGLDPAKVRKAPKPLNRYRTKDDVMAAILRRRLQEKPLHGYAMMHGAHRDLSLWNKARRLFGQWSRAVAAAGFDYAKITPERIKYKQPAEVIAAIRRRQDQDLALTATAIRKGGNHDANLYIRGCRFYGDWTSALAAAGIDHASIVSSRSSYPTKEAVIHAIKRRCDEGKPLHIPDLRKGEDKDQALYSNGLRLFGNWLTAVREAGAETKGLRHPGGKYPTKHHVTNEIRRRIKQGLTLNTERLMKGPDADRALYTKAYRLYGGWPAAVQAAEKRL